LGQEETSPAGNDTAQDMALSTPISGKADQCRDCDSLEWEEMMQFGLGDKVMHPKFGVGEITGRENRELVEGFKHYYVIKVFATGATAYVPTQKMDELGVRPVMSRIELAQVLETLRSTPHILSKDYKKRQARIQEKFATARPISVAEAVRDLTCRRRHRKLTYKDEQLLNRGRELLESEMTVATNLQVPDAREAINAALDVALEEAPDGSERARVPVTAS
jgi:CarD family transcriptional regulator